MLAVRCGAPHRARLHKGFPSRLEVAIDNEGQDAAPHLVPRDHLVQRGDQPRCCRHDGIRKGCATPSDAPKATESRCPRGGALRARARALRARGSPRVCAGTIGPSPSSPRTGTCCRSSTQTRPCEGCAAPASRRCKQRRPWLCVGLGGGARTGEAGAQGATVVGVRGADCVVLGVERLEVSALKVCPRARARVCGAGTSPRRRRRTRARSRRSAKWMTTWPSPSQGSRPMRVC